VVLVVLILVQVVVLLVEMNRVVEVVVQVS
jgi:hypothetical protein